MSLKELLLEKQSAIVDSWCDITRQTYPEESQVFFRKKDQFGNPIGHAISLGLPLLFEALVEGKHSERVAEILDSIVRIRAIQEFAPSEAVSFVLGLKSVLREELGRQVLQNGLSKEWMALEGKIDSMALLGFDIYTRCREQIFEIRVKEVKKQSERLLQVSGMTFAIPEWKGDQEKIKPLPDSKK